MDPLEDRRHRDSRLHTCSAARKVQLKTQLAHNSTTSWRRRHALPLRSLPGCFSASVGRFVCRTEEEHTHSNSCYLYSLQIMCGALSLFNVGHSDNPGADSTYLIQFSLFYIAQYHMLQMCLTGIYNLYKYDIPDL